MLFSVLERLVLLSILPREGDYLTLKILGDLRRELSFSEDEHQRLNFRTEEGRMFWDAEEEKEVAVGKKAQEVIKEALTELDKQKKLTEDHIPLYERFIEGDL